MALPRTISFEFLAPCYLGKLIMSQFQEITWTEGRMDRPYFERSVKQLPLHKSIAHNNAMIPISKDSFLGLILSVKQTASGQYESTSKNSLS